MLKEFEALRQEKTGFRSLFVSSDFNLFVWYNEKHGEIIGFQLIYQLNGLDKAFNWTKEEGYNHFTIDGLDNTSYAGTPLLVSNGIFNLNTIMDRLEMDIFQIPIDIKNLVLEKLNEYNIK